MQAQKRLPTETDILAKATNFDGADGGATAGPAPTKALPKSKRLDRAGPEERDTLIPSDIDYAIRWRVETQRIQDIWHELQYNLTFDRHPNAIAVLARVVLELTTDTYLAHNTDAGAHENDKLPTKIEKVAQHMCSKSKIEEKYSSELRKLANADKIISTNTLNRYIHSSSFNPAKQHLIPIWDTLALYMVKCLNM